MSDRPKDIAKGDVIRAAWLNRAKNASVNDIVVAPGTGLTSARTEGRITISRQGQLPNGTSERTYLVEITGQGTTGDAYYTATEQVWDRTNSQLKDGTRLFGGSGNLDELIDVNGVPTMTEGSLGRARVLGGQWIVEPLTTVVRAEITALSNDTLTAKRLDDTETKVGSALTVNKPWKLLHDASEYPSVTGVTTTNTNELDATDGTDTETWVVTPIYTVGDYVFIVLHQGEYYDLNIDGRAWAVNSS